MKKFEKILESKNIKFNKNKIKGFWWEITTLYTEKVMFSRHKPIKSELGEEYFTIDFEGTKTNEDEDIISLCKVSPKQFEAILDRCDEFVEKYNSIYQELQNHTRNFEKSIIDMEEE